MNEKTAYVISHREGHILVNSPDVLLEYSPYTLVNESASAEPTGFNWAYRDRDNNIIGTEYSCNVFLKDASNGNSKHSIMPIEKSFASTVNLLPGSKLTYSIDGENKLLIVERINNKPIGEKVSKLRPSYPTRMIPLDNWGFTSMRIFSLLAPIGFGQCSYIVAPGNSGKTSLLLEVWESLLRLTNVLPNLYVIFLNIGERKKDASLFQYVQDSVEHDEDRVEFYSASSPDADEIQTNTSSEKILQGQWRLFDYLSTQRVTSLANNWDCFYGIDSLHRAAAAHSFGNISTSSSLMGGGFNTQSMFEATMRVQTAANFGGCSLTTMSVLIGNYNRSDGKPSVLENISRETRDHVPDSVWSLTDTATLFPKVDLDGSKTQTRRAGSFAPKQLLQERDAVTQLIWNTSKNENPGSKAEQAHRTLINYCKSNPIPQWAVSPPKEPITPKHLETLNLGESSQENTPVAYLFSKTASQYITEMSGKTGKDLEKIIEEALNLHRTASKMGYKL